MALSASSSQHLSDMDREALNLNQESINAILRSKRKGRNLRACYPCRQRKVKCDDQRPCHRCRDRGHPEICLYDPKQFEAENGQQTLEKNAGIIRDSLGPTDETSRSPPLIRDGIAFFSQPYVGRESLRPYSLDDVTQIATEHGTGSVSSCNALHSTLETIPFALNSSTPHEVTNNLTAKFRQPIPTRNEIISLFHCYRQIVYPVNPHIVDINRFETQLGQFLENLSDDGENPQNEVSDAETTSAPWKALLFVILASGIQYSNRPYDERQSKSKAYVSEAFNLLGAFGIYTNPSIEAVQVLLLMVDVLQNDYLIEAAWCIIGVMSRLAQSLGLHKIATDKSDSERGNSLIWHHIVWQDTTLSVCLNRSPSTAIRANTTYLETLQESLPYREGIYLLARWSLKMLSRNHDPFATEPVYQEFVTGVQDAEDLTALLKPELAFRNRSTNLQDLVQHLSYRMHSAFCRGCLLRPALHSSAWRSKDPISRRMMSFKCFDAYCTSLEAFLDLQSLSIIPSRSWVCIHEGLVSALVVAITSPNLQNQRSKILLSRLSTLLKQGFHEDDHEKASGQMWTPHVRAIAVIRKLLQFDTERPAFAPHPNNLAESFGFSPGYSHKSPSTAMTATPDLTRQFISFKDILNMDPRFLGEYSARLQDSLEDVLESVIYVDANDENPP